MWAKTARLEVRPVSKRNPTACIFRVGCRANFSRKKSVSLKKMDKKESNIFLLLKVKTRKQNEKYFLYEQTDF